MKKKVFSLSLITCSIIFLGISIFSNATYSKFNANNVKENISVLSSSTYSGRLPGTNENSLVAEIIQKTFEKNNLKPLNSDYKENFNVICPTKTNTKPYFSISNHENKIYEFNYGIDFKEDMLNFKNNTITFSNKDKITINHNSILVNSNNSSCIFIAYEKEDLSFRSSFSNDFPYDMVISITKDTYSKIVDFLNKDYNFSIHVPFTTVEKEISNIVGVIKGYSKNLPPLVITAHYDHLGKDGLGNTYGGALDNASGTSFLLELQRSLASYGKPKRDIIFVALNAEEFGLLGSQNFARNNIDIIQNSQVLNFDMIGIDNCPVTLMLGESFNGKDSSLLNSIVNISEKYSPHYEVVYKNSSDHSSFNDFNIDALTISHGDVSNIHTPEDTVEFINVNAIDNINKIVDKKIKTFCYGYTTNFFYSNASMFILSLIVGYLIKLHIDKYKVKK